MKHFMRYSFCVLLFIAGSAGAQQRTTYPTPNPGMPVCAEPSCRRYPLEPTVGVNTVNPQALTQAEQDAMVSALNANHVKTIRLPLINASSIHMIEQAYRNGIGTIIQLFPTQGSAKALANMRQPDPPFTKWAQAPLSAADPQGFKEWLTPFIAELQRAGVKVTAFEMGNEINSAGYNGDFLVPGTTNIPGNGRVLGFDDLERGWTAWYNRQPITDPEATNIAAGFYIYLSIIDTARTVIRSVSPLNADTPVISAGAVYNTKLPHPSTTPNANGPPDIVPAADFVHFLQRHGLDDRVDGYGIHIYYSKAQSIDDALSICGGARRKPCWITEWGGFSTANVTCPLGYGPNDDMTNYDLVTKVREAYRPFIQQGLVVNTMYYSWNSGGNIWIPACEGMTRSGRLALAPY